MYLQLSELNLSLPKIISDFPLKHRVVSLSGKSYEVDLLAYSCSCHNWQEERIHFSIQDIRRACKHISSLMNIIPFYWILPIPTCNYRLSTTELEGYIYGLIQKENNEWIDIYVLNRKNDVYDYGYNVSERRWSRKQKPRHSKYLRPLIVKWIESSSPSLWQVYYGDDSSPLPENLKLEEDNLLEII